VDPVVEEGFDVGLVDYVEDAGGLLGDTLDTRIYRGVCSAYDYEEGVYQVR
jgi:hypothetical protein